MRKKRVFYPLNPTEGTYRQPRTAYLNMVTRFDAFICGSIANEHGEVKTFDNIPTILDELKKCGASTVVTYDIDFLACSFQYLINAFEVIDGIGKNLINLNLSYTKGDKVKKICIISCRSFIEKSIYTACKRLDIQIRSLPKIENYNEWVKYSVSHTVATRGIWVKLRSATRDLFGVHPSRTPGATSIKTLRPFLSAPIKNRGRRMTKLTSQSIRPGLLYWETGEFPNVYHYDINGAYPFIMGILQYPHHLKTFINCEPPTNKYIATVKFNYRSDFKISPLSVKIKPSNYTVYPTSIKNHRTTLTYIDIQLMRQFGELDILDWIEGAYWDELDQTHIFKSWSDTVGEASLNPHNKLLLKVVSRSLHSKFAQSGGMIKSEVIQVNPKEIDKLIKRKVITDFYPLDNGGLAVRIAYRQKPTFKPFTRPDIESLTLAMGRALVLSAVDDNTIYVDTDCIISTQPREDLDAGLNFGQWKLSTSGHCVIGGPRLYVIDRAVKASGIRPANYNALIKGIRDTMHNKLTIVEAIEKLNPLREHIQHNRISLREHTIRVINRPIVTVKGNTATVHFNTRQEKIKPLKRLVSVGFLKYTRLQKWLKSAIIDGKGIL